MLIVHVDFLEKKLSSSPPLSTDLEILGGSDSKSMFFPSVIYHCHYIIIIIVMYGVGSEKKDWEDWERGGIMITNTKGDPFFLETCI